MFPPLKSFWNLSRSKRFSSAKKWKRKLNSLWGRGKWKFSKNQPFAGSVIKALSFLNIWTRRAFGALTQGFIKARPTKFAAGNTLSANWATKEWEKPTPRSRRRQKMAALWRSTQRFKGLTTKESKWPNLAEEKLPKCCERPLPHFRKVSGCGTLGMRQKIAPKRENFENTRFISQFERLWRTHNYASNGKHGQIKKFELHCRQFGKIHFFLIGRAEIYWQLCANERKFGQIGWNNAKRKPCQNARIGGKAGRPFWSFG